MKNEEQFNIPNFNFVLSYKRPEVLAAGIAIYHNTQDVSYMDIHTKFTKSIGVNVSDVGEICIAHYNSKIEQYILMVAIYISPRKSMIQKFLFENLTIYTKEGSEILEKRFGKAYDNEPMILSGDFNIKFADDKNLPLIDFVNDKKHSATKYKTTIDAVFTRYLDEFQSHITLVTINLLYPFLNTEIN